MNGRDPQFGRPPERDQVGRMGCIYATGEMAPIVAAAGIDGFMNLGWSPDVIGRQTTRDRQRQLVGRVTDALQLRGSESVLDVGCGRAGLARLLSSLHPGLSVVGSNIDREQLRLAPVSERFVQATAERQPFPDRSFDRVIVVEVLSHLPDKLRFAHEAARVLRDGGLLVVAMIALNRPFADFAESQRSHLRRLANLFDEEPSDVCTVDSVRDTFDEAGLDVVSTDDLTDGVFGPRHEEFVDLLRMLRSPDAVEREALVRTIEEEWHADVASLERFLTVNVESHPCRYYEYHLVVARKG